MMKLIKIVKTTLIIMQVASGKKKPKPSFSITDSSKIILIEHHTPTADKNSVAENTCLVKTVKHFNTEVILILFHEEYSVKI